MAFEVSYTLDNEQQFWDELDDILSVDSHSHEQIDDTLRTYLSFASQFKGEYLTSDYDVLRCAYRLHSSSVFKNAQNYVRTQIVHCLLQEDSSDTLHIITAFVLYDGRQFEETFDVLNEEGGFPRILELIQNAQEDDVGFHRLLLQLMYEMSRVQRVKHQDLVLVDEEFIVYLLRITEGLSSDVNDPYHYYVIRVLLVLNEQFMVCAHDPGPSGSHGAPLTNIVIASLSRHGPSYKTFGENIILLLNRESETSLQLLILKLLYLLFTTSATYEYFYTNDLRVLVDVMIRNLLDLAFSSTALRHTYLRVLYPLLAHTQLKYNENHYKRDELLKLLSVMSGGGSGLLHIGDMDETTIRLVHRCQRVDWLAEASSEGNSPVAGGSPHLKHLQIGQNADASRSNLSVVEVTTPKAKPGVRTLSRSDEMAHQMNATVMIAENPGIDVNNDAPNMSNLVNPFHTEVEG